MPITREAIENAAMLGLRLDRLEVLENFVTKFFNEDKRQCASIKIQRHGVPIFEGGYGISTKEFGLKPDTIFAVASITKPVIAALLLILQEDGLLDLTEPVRRYLPEFDGGGRENIQVWHFLTHTSGLKDEEMDEQVSEYVKNEFGFEHPADGSGHEEWEAYGNKICEKMGLDPKAPQNDRLNDSYYMLTLKQPILHTPRSHMTYCNYGYQMLKNIIDAVTGEPIDVFARRVLFDPLGMPNTYWNLPEDKWDKVVGRNERAKGYPWMNTEHSFKNESGSGGLKTTVSDITRFLQMVLNGGILDNKRVLSKASITQMTINHNEGVSCNEDVKYSSWGLGWNYKNNKKDDAGILRSTRSIEHGGWGGTKVLADPETGLTAALFSVAYDIPDKDAAIFFGPVLNILYTALD